MSHIHKIEKNKGQDAFSSDSVAVIEVKNTSQMSISIGVILYPGDTAFACEDHPKVASAVKKGKLSVVASHQNKAKSKKQKTEDSITTVAETEPEASVQLTTQEDDAAASGTEL